MRRDREDAVQHEADELAAEAFDRYPPDVEQWVRDAFVGEWGLNAENAARHVMWAAVGLLYDPACSEFVGVLRNAVSQLREAYVDHASTQGLYAATAEDRINSAISDEAERARDLADDRNVDAYQSGLRG